MQKKLIIPFIILFTLQGCIVSKKKFDDLLAQKVKADGELAETSAKLDKATAELEDLNASLNQLKSDTLIWGWFSAQQRKNLRVLILNMIN